LRVASLVQVTEYISAGEESLHGDTSALDTTTASSAPTTEAGGVTAAVPGAHELAVRDTSRIFGRVRELAQRGASASEVMAVLPPEAAAGGELPVVSHYARHVAALQGGDFSGAVDNLHRFFDLQAASAGWSRGALAPPDGGVRAVRAPFHYATMSLTALHHQFGHRESAMAAMLETIRYGLFSSVAVRVICAPAHHHLCDHRFCYFPLHARARTHTHTHFCHRTPT
jgi:hypothetical protein